MWHRRVGVGVVVALTRVDAVLRVRVHVGVCVHVVVVLFKAVRVPHRRQRAARAMSETIRLHSVERRRVKAPPHPSIEEYPVPHAAPVGRLVDAS